MCLVTPRTNRRILTLLATAVVALVWHARPVLAQSPAPDLTSTATGTLYIVAFPDTVSNTLDVRYPNTRVRSEASFYLFSPTSNRVEITPSVGVGTTLMLDSNKFKIYKLPSAATVDVAGSVVPQSVTVKADKPIVLYCYYGNIQGVEAWTPLPVELWGKSYRAAMIQGDIVYHIGVAGETEVPTTPIPAPAEILVIGGYDNTTVRLTPPPGTDFAEGTPRVAHLNRGDVFQVRSYVRIDTGQVQPTTQMDIGATLIEADKPVGVISGNTRTAAIKTEGLKNNAYKNMMMEWLRPVEQYGRQFVFMGTWDSHRPGIGAAAERQREMVRLYGDGKAVRGYYLQPGGVEKMGFETSRDTTTELTMTRPTATYIRTEEPAQVMMHSTAIVQFNGSTPCFRGIPCFSYSAWVPYMVELVPREQWTSFAPYYASTNPGGMQHYINVVTDTLSVLKIVRENGSTFLFNRKIPGTDLIWGSMSVSIGESNWLMGKDGARFWGFVYGLCQGGEEYRPGRTRKKDNDAQPASGGASGGASGEAGALHPCEYEEYNGVSYGYPLISAGRVLGNASAPAGVDLDGYGAEIVTSGDVATIRYTLGRAGEIRAGIYDASGTLVETLAPVNAGRQGEIQWNASGHPSGAYYCRISSGLWSRTLPIILAR